MERKDYLLIALVFLLALALGGLFAMGVKVIGSMWEETRVEEVETGTPVGMPLVDAEEMLRYYREVLQRNPDDPKALAGIADAYFELQEFKTASEYYRKAIERDPEDVDSYNDLGLSLHYIGRSEEGLRYVEEGIKVDPSYQRIWLTKGFILATTGRIEEAREAWQRAYSLGPDTDVGRAAMEFLQQYRAREGG